jgi:hypothetical protein
VLEKALGKFLPNGAAEIFGHAQELLRRKPKPTDQMSPLQATVWLTISDMLTEMGVVDPLRSVLLRLVESQSDEQLIDYLRGLVKTACKAQDILEDCGVAN